MRQTTMRSYTLVSVAIFALALSACGGGSGATHALPGGTTPLAGGTSILKIALTVPSAAMQVHRRSPKYIAPTTKGFGFDFATSSSALNPAQPTIAVNFSNPAAPSIAVDTYGGSAVSCAVNPDGSELCNFSLTIPVSSTPYYLQVSTFDSAPSATASPVFNTLDLLSQQTITPVSVSSGTPTTPISLSLDGIPASAELVSLPNQVHLQPNSGGYTLIGMTPVQAHIYALDRDGNIIVGDGAPQICVQSPTNTTTGAPYIATTVPASTPGPSGQICDTPPTVAPIVAPTWTLQTKSWSPSPLSLTLTAVATGGSGASATSTLSLNEEQEVWVGWNSTTSIQFAGYAFTPSGSGTPGTLSPILTDFGGTTAAYPSTYGSAFDPTNGTLWVAGSDSAGAFMDSFAPPLNAVPFPSLPFSSIASTSGASLIDTSLTKPENMAVDSSQRLWVVDPSYNFYGPPVLLDFNVSNPSAPTGPATPMPAPTSSASPAPAFGGGLALDPGTEGDGRPPTLWLSGTDASGKETIFAYDIASGTPVPMTINGALSISGMLPNGIAVGANGEIFLAENSNTENLGIYQSAYSGGQYTLTQPTGTNVSASVSTSSTPVYSLAATYPNAAGLFDVLIGGTYLTGPYGSGALLDCAGAPNALSCPTLGATSGYDSQSPLNAATTVVVVP